MRFLRAPEYNQLFSGDPVWPTDVSRWAWATQPPPRDQSNFRMLTPADALASLYLSSSGSTACWCLFKRYAAKVSIDTSVVQ